MSAYLGYSMEMVAERYSVGYSACLYGDDAWNKKVLFRECPRWFGCFLPIFKEAPGLPMLALLMPLCVRLIFKPGKILMLLRNLKSIFPPFAKPVRCVFQLIEVNSENLRSSSTSLVGCPHRDIRIFFIW